MLCHRLALKLPFQLLLQGGFHRSTERCDKLWHFPGLQNGEVVKWDLKASWPHSQCYCPTIPTPNPAVGLRDVVCSLTVVLSTLEQVLGLADSLYPWGSCLL